MQAKPHLWPGRPKLLPGESLSSWFGRVAAANALTPDELYRVVVPGAHLHSRDLDREACESLMETMTSNTGQERRALDDAVLSRWLGTLYGEDDGRCRLPWLPPIGRHNHAKSFGQQYCPQCLVTEKTPYFRLEWRLSFMTACPRHLTLLIDRCPKCAEPVIPLRTLRHQGRLLCGKCHGDLAEAESVPVPWSSLALQTRLRQVAGEGWAEDGDGRPVFGLAYFALARAIFRLLCSSTTARALRAWAAEEADLDIRVEHIPRVKEVERLTTSRRHDLLQLAWVYLRDWPHALIEACRKNHIPQWHLSHHREALPFAFAEAVLPALAAPVRRVDAAELEAAKEFLVRRGFVPTYDALQGLLGVKFEANRHVAEPADERASHGTGRYWKLDGVDPDVRRAVLHEAHKNGENVSAWVERTLCHALKKTNVVFTSDG